jgi:serine/threonine protein kinase
MAMTSLPMVGEEWAGYRLRGVIGRGGMSTVHEAENPRLGSLVALKVLAPELAEDDVFRARFLKESRIAASLNHPNVIPIYDMGSSDGLLHIAMRYVSGADLRSVLEVRHLLPPDEALTLIGQTARALDSAHRQGLVHRDVKPGNILVEGGGDEDDPDHVYLSDFGISKYAMSRSGLTATGEFMGTIDYLAPEQIQGRPVDGRADLYSLACVLYQCVTGRVPFPKDIDAAIIWAHVEEWPTLPSVVRPELPSSLDDVLMRAMAKQPDDRYQSCRKFVAAARATWPARAPSRHPARRNPPARPGRPASRPRRGRGAGPPGHGGSRPWAWSCCSSRPASPGWRCAASRPPNPPHRPRPPCRA